MDKAKALELIKTFKYDANGLIPAIAQDHKTKQVLMLAYMNQESLARTINEGKACYWSRSRKKFWVKGETSGHFQVIKEMWYDCDMDALVLIIDQTGPACHTGETSCFYRRLV
jgi:phosphoribosyl-AMP cyclohydrolase